MHAGIRTLWAGVAAVFLLAMAPRPVAAEDNKAATGSVEGKVRFRGKPLSGGVVGFHPEKGKPVLAKIDTDGNYLAPAVPVGAVKVTVDTKPAKPRPGGGRPAPFIPIPAKYATPETSGLTLTVQKGKQTFDIELK
jgi:hypothetical protein